MERLQKVLAQAGIASRRKSEQLILAGRVKVNGQRITKLGVKVNPDHDQIEVDGRPIKREKKKIFLFYKPKFVITSMVDPQGRKVVADYLQGIKERVYPVGRLDYDTEGLLLLTNDGSLAHRLMHPRFQIEKEYIATVKGKPCMSKIERLRKGVRLTDGWTAPAKVERLSTKDGRSKLKIIIHEGRNRQIRRMCQAIGHPVLELLRTRVAFLTLTGLKKGSYRELSSQEYDRLKQMLLKKDHRSFK